MYSSTSKYVCTSTGSSGQLLRLKLGQARFYSFRRIAQYAGIIFCLYNIGIKMDDNSKVSVRYGLEYINVLYMAVISPPPKKKYKYVSQ